MHIDEVVLRFLEGENEGVEIKLTPIRELNIGRSEESDVFLGEKKISRKHCQIFVKEESVSLLDLESTNGTFVNTKKVSGEIELQSGDQIKVGSSVIEVRIQSSDVDEVSTKAKESLAPKPKGKSTPVKEEISLDELDDLDEDISKPLAKDESDLVVEYQTSAKKKPAETSEKLGVDLDVKNKSGSLDDLADSEEQGLDLSNLDMGEEDEESFAQIPDLKELASDEMDQDVSLDEEKSSSKNAKPLSGDLSSMGLADLLQNLFQNKKSGIITLSNETYEGKVLIKEGAITGAECGKSTGTKAMYRMLSWKSGDFEFKPLPSDSKELTKGQNPVEGSVEGILMEGFRQFDELKKIQKVLPQMDDELVLEEKLETPISKLHPKVLDVVQLVINHRKMKFVLDLSPFSDLETSKIIFYLIKKKIIRVK